jgi:hypothetical protein
LSVFALSEARRTRVTTSFPPAGRTRKATAAGFSELAPMMKICA